MTHLRRILVTVMLLAGAAGTHAETFTPLEGWEYRWGDGRSPDGALTWPTNPGPDSAWQPIDFPSNPPDRHGQTNAWFRTTVPELTSSDPAIYIYSIDLIAELYLDGERIYHYGTFNEDGTGRFVGWPWHIIPLPGDSTGKTVYFRVYSNYTDIGLWGEVLIGSEAAFQWRLLTQSAKSILIGVFCLTLAVVALVMAVLEGRVRTFASVGLLAAATGLTLLAEAPASLLLLHLPLFWDYIGAGAYYLLPVAVARLLEGWFPRSRSRPIRWVWQGHLCYLLVALSASLLGWINLSITFPIFDGLLLVSIGTLLWVTLINLRGISRAQALMLAAFGFYALVLVLDMAWAHGFIPRNPIPLSWGGLAFVLASGAIALQQYHRNQLALVEVNQSLENRVAERTAALEELSTVDPLTGVLNRRAFDGYYNDEIERSERLGTTLSLLMIDLDHFKDFNDANGHLAGDHALRTIAQLMESRFRATDRVCRYGGEEFTVLLPGASAPAAESVATELLAAARRTHIHFNNTDLGTITLSIGIANWPAHTGQASELLDLADRALYRAKRDGRDRYSVHDNKHSAAQ